MAKKLPTLKEIETKELNLFGYLLTFRKLNLDDIEKFNNWANDGMLPVEYNKRLLAQLMHGYNATFEERLDFINKMEVDNLNVVSQTDELLAELGVVFDEVDESENVEKPNSKDQGKKKLKKVKRKPTKK